MNSKRHITESNRIGFVQYTHDDDADMLICWQDRDTQKGYNYAFDGSLNDLSSIDISAFPFWVVVVDKDSGAKIGVLRLSSREEQDLAIWIYPNYRGKGYGIVAENRASLDYTQINHYFVVTTTHTPGENHLAESELDSRTVVKWVAFDELVQLINDQEFDRIQGKYLKARDVAALREYAKLIKR